MSNCIMKWTLLYLFFLVTVGHDTVMARVSIFGAPQGSEPSSTGTLVICWHPSAII